MIKHGMQCFVALLIIASASPASHAGESIDPATLVPADTLLLISHSAADQTEAARRGTALEKTLTDPQVARFVDAVWTALDGFARREVKKEHWLKEYEAAIRVLGTLWRSTTALAIIDAGMGEHGPSVEAVFFSQIGKDAKSFEEDVLLLLKWHKLDVDQEVQIAGKAVQRIRAPIPGGLHVGVVDGTFLVSVGTKAAEAILAGGPKDGANLEKSERLAIARKRIGGDAGSRIFTLYANTTLIRKRAESFVPSDESGEEVRKQIDGVLAALGLKDVRSICWEMHAKGRGYLDAVYLYSGNTPAGRDKTLDANLLSAIPRSPWWAAAMRIDLAAIYDRAFEVIGLFDDEIVDDLRKEIVKLEKRMGLRLRDDLLKPLGPAIAVFDATENGGFFITGATVVAETSDGAQLREGLRKLVAAIAREADGAKQTSVRTEKYRDREIEYVNVAGMPMPISPAWSVHDKQIILALYPQVVRTTIDRLSDEAAGGNSIASNEDVMAATKVIGPIGDSFLYSDTRSAMEQAYPWLLLLGQMGASAAQAEGVKIDGSVFPTQAALTRYLFADVKTSRVDENGALTISYGPLPVSVPVFSGGAFAPAMMASILLPSLARARELSKRTVCLANLRGIGQGMHIYASDHDDKFPPNFKALIDAQDATAKQFVCPSTALEPGDPDACYEYIAGQGTNSNPRNVLVYEKDGHHGDEGASVLYVDGRAEFVRPYERVEQLVRETRERMTSNKPREATDPAGGDR